MVEGKRIIDYKRKYQKDKNRIKRSWKLEKAEKRHKK